jgi:hypothetical protein
MHYLFLIVLSLPIVLAIAPSQPVQPVHVQARQSCLDAARRSGADIRYPLGVAEVCGMNVNQTSSE